jgi:hypothetical protein
MYAHSAQEGELRRGEEGPRQDEQGCCCHGEEHRVQEVRAVVVLIVYMSEVYEVRAVVLLIVCMSEVCTPGLILSYIHTHIHTWLSRECPEDYK